MSAPEQLPIVPAPDPKTIADAVRSMHDVSLHMANTMARLEHWAELQRKTPEFRTIVINPGNNGQYAVTDTAAWTAKSIGVLNPGSAPVFVGIAGISARPGSRAPVCPGSASLILPVEVETVELGCDPAVLAANTAVVYLFRFVTVQPLVLRQVP